MNVRNIFFCYNLARKEGEGIGTAYEYFVKSRLIDKLFEKIGKPKNILIAGLPEKYGYALDFIFLASWYNCNIDIVDEREDVIKNFNRILNELAESYSLVLDNIKTQKVKELENINTGTNRYYELAFSPAVLQRIKEEDRYDYLKQLSKKARYVLLFVPNKANRAHQRYTGLNSLSIEELLKYSKQSTPNSNILDSGRIDLPPFPPGIKVTSVGGHLIKNRAIIKIFIKFLNIWANIEPFFPEFIKNKFAHIAYLISVSKNERNY